MRSHFNSQSNPKSSADPCSRRSCDPDCNGSLVAKLWLGRAQAPTDGSSGNQNSASGLSTGAKAGIGVASVAGAAIFGILLLFCWRRQSKKGEGSDVAAGGAGAAPSTPAPSTSPNSKRALSCSLLVATSIRRCILYRTKVEDIRQMLVRSILRITITSNTRNRTKDILNRGAIRLCRQQAVRIQARCRTRSAANRCSPMRCRCRARFCGLRVRRGTGSWWGGEDG
jgi:hypothetical protein